MADLLRRAAVKIVETAEGADPGPWRADGLDPNGCYYVHDSDDVPAGYFGVNVIAEHAHEENAEHIALWSPNIALGFAELLLATAAGLERRGVTARPTLAERQAAHLACRILGEV